MILTLALMAKFQDDILQNDEMNFLLFWHGISRWLWFSLNRSKDHFQVGKVGFCHFHPYYHTPFSSTEVFFMKKLRWG